MLVNNDYVYAIAGGEALQIIDFLKKEAETAKAGVRAFGEGFGAVVDLEDKTKPIFNFPAGSDLPRGWEKGVNGAWPSQSSPEGHGLHYQLERMLDKLQIQSRFDALCRTLGPSSPFNSYKYSFEEIGSKTIILIPPTWNKEGPTHIMPPDSTEISAASYLQMKESFDAPAPKQIATFKKSFAQMGLK